MRNLRTFGFEGHNYAVREGVNSRLDELQAAILRVKLKHLPDQLEKRRNLASSYNEHLPTCSERLTVGNGVWHSYHLYVVKFVERDVARAKLANSGINTSVHYPFPIHLMSAYSFLGYSTGALPITESRAGHILSLPLYPELSTDDIRRVCTVLSSLPKDSV